MKRTEASRHAPFARANTSRAVTHAVTGVSIFWRAGRASMYVGTACGKAMPTALLTHTGPVECRACSVRAAAQPSGVESVSANHEIDSPVTKERI